MPNFQNIVSHLQGSDWIRPKQRSWAVFINRPDKNKGKKKKHTYLGSLSHSHNFLDDADKPLAGNSALKLSTRNAIGCYTILTSTGPSQA